MHNAIPLALAALLPVAMSIILGSGGSKSKALSIHGVTCLAMLVAGILLIRTL